VVKATLTEFALITVAVPMVRTLGIVVTEIDSLDGGEIPLELVAVTENV
jgi:hypothetical protein